MKDYLMSLGFGLRSSTAAAVDVLDKRDGDRAIHVMHFKNNPEEIEVAEFEFNKESMEWNVVKDVTFKGHQSMDAKLFIHSLGI